MTEYAIGYLRGSLKEGIKDQLQKTARIQIGYLDVKGEAIEKLFEILQLAQLGIENSVVLGNSGLCALRCRFLLSRFFCIILDLRDRPNGKKPLCP